MKTIIIDYKKGIEIREKFLLWLLGVVIPVHARFYGGRKPWGLSASDLLGYPAGTLGNELGRFLKTEHLEPVDRVERHDAFHILLDFTTRVPDEAAMQFFLLGNGKVSPFTLGTALFSAAILPEHTRNFYLQFQRGRSFRSIARWDFKKLLPENFQDLKRYIFRTELKDSSLEKRLLAGEFDL